MIVGAYWGFRYYQKTQKAEEDFKKVGNMTILSSVFTNNSQIPEIYSCRGGSVSPPLEFLDVPANASSLALIMDDPDAPIGTFVHWVIYNMPPNTKGIEEHATPPGKMAPNSLGRASYTAPCPPSGTHRYFFKLYALDQNLTETEIEGKASLEKAMEGHIVAQSRLVGLFTYKEE